MTLKCRYPRIFIQKASNYPGEHTGGVTVYVVADITVWAADMLIAYAHYVELYINQLAYAMVWNSPLINPSGPRAGSGLLPGFERLKRLWKSLESIKG